MFITFFRRIQKYLWVIKLVLFALSACSIGYTLYAIPPDLITIPVFSVLLFIVIFLFFEFALRFVPKVNASFAAFRIALATSLLLFLRAVNLFTAENLILVGAFIALMSLHLYKDKSERVKSKQ